MNNQKNGKWKKYYNKQVVFEDEYENNKWKNGKGKKYNLYGDLKVNI